MAELFFNAARAVAELKRHNVKAAVLKLNRITPIDIQCFNISNNYKSIYFFEEGIKNGGIGEHFGTGLFEHGYKGKYRLFAIDNQYVRQGSVDKLLSLLGLDSDGMVKTVLSGVL